MLIGFSNTALQNTINGCLAYVVDQAQCQKTGQMKYSGIFLFLWNKFKATLSLFSTWNIANSLDQSTSNLQKLLRFGEADPE